MRVRSKNPKHAMSFSFGPLVGTTFVELGEHPVLDREVAEAVKAGLVEVEKAEPKEPAEEDEGTKKKRTR